MLSGMTVDTTGPPEDLPRRRDGKAQPGLPVRAGAIKDAEIYKESLTDQAFRHIIGRR